MIVRAECYEKRPIDRDYNAKGKPRQTQVEILGGGACYMPFGRNSCTGY